MNHCTGTIDNDHQYIEFSEGEECPLCEAIRDNKLKSEEIQALNNELMRKNMRLEYLEKKISKLKEGG